MTRRRSKKKTSKHSRSNPVTPGGLNRIQFDALPQEFKSFIVEDEEGEKLEFAKGDVVYVSYREDPEEEATNMWIGKIDEIRAGAPDDVWVKLQWYWSPQEVAMLIKSFDPDLCGKREKLFSDYFDYLSVNCFVGHVDVTFFAETSICQPTIGQDEWYSRYEFKYYARRVVPKVTHVACNLCGVPYNPDIDEVLHFCPRPGCRVAYHQACLMGGGFADGEDRDRKRRLLETWPDVMRTESVESLVGAHPPRKRRRKGRNGESTNDPLARFPAQLIAVAEQQIVRGTHAGGIVGNVTPVCAARRLIYSALCSEDVIPDDWETHVDVSAAFPKPFYPLPNCICPTCLSPI